MFETRLGARGARQGLEPISSLPATPPPARDARFRPQPRARFLPLACLLGMSVGCAAQTGSEDDDSVAAAAEESLVVAPGNLWPRTIEVCWDPGSTQVDGPGQTRYTERRAQVRAAIARTWEAFSRVRTTGWGICPSSGPFGDRLLITSRAGRARASVGRTENNWIGLDLDSDVLDATAIHEFGHSLGFYHEQSDPRTPSWCTEHDDDLRSDPPGSLAVSDWDPDSIMNYCNDFWWLGTLSPTDISGLQRFYGSRPHDATGDRRDDIVIAGVDPALEALYIGGSTGTGFTPEVRRVSQFATWITNGGRPVSGDFDGNGLLDVALVAGRDWGTIPVALARRDGSYTVTNLPAPNFPAWAYTLGVTAVVLDYNADGRDDIGLAGGADWGSTPVALSRGDGTFDITNPAAGDFAIWARQGAQLVAGDFDGDGYSDMALVGGTGWSTLPVKFTRTRGTGYHLTNAWTEDFAIWAQQPGARAVAGDFNGDSRTDIALVGGRGWSTIPVAVSLGDGSFRVTNLRYDGFPVWATQGATPVVGDFDDDGFDDIALTGGGPGWSTVPVASGGSFFGVQVFRIANLSSPDVATWSTLPGVRIVTRTAAPRRSIWIDIAPIGL